MLHSVVFQEVRKDLATEPTILIYIDNCLRVNGLNAPTKRHRLVG